MIAPASRSFCESVDSYGTWRLANASAPPVVIMSTVWTLSLSTMGMPCSGPRMYPCARSTSRSCATAIADGLTVIIAFSVPSYAAMRSRYSFTSCFELI